MNKGKIYFASDFHLGVPTREISLEREKLIVQWLDEIRKDAAEIYLMGDMFDFWFEYKNAVPKGFTRLLGKLAEICDSGIPVYLFTGNHDMWMFDYLQDELGVIIYRKPVVKEFNGKKFFLAHGDGLGPGDRGYKFIKKVFANPLLQWMFARIHPNTGIGIANFWSGQSRGSGGIEKDKWKGDENEYLVQFVKKTLLKEHYDYFIFGHRHLPLEMKIADSVYINLGEWINYSSYAVFDGDKVELKSFRPMHA
ncbi:MAG TPA: UDP-2,3-diacylglucosamine diphosphatase [Bacteroidia bacterium]|jgi:UDP-2,3-diacylglucosamine hydrolase|nr:UDP-2,3-diacylglucosamine diphosphatase [Bacteroidia bacterium]